MWERLNRNQKQRRESPQRERERDPKAKTSSIVKTRQRSGNCRNLNPKSYRLVPAGFVIIGGTYLAAAL
ncbi:hypothetical protein QQP08_010990 [Theobroma cacao]|nr:hypothetical protein QQP08_010990 [Theobroma cacao]